MLRVINLSQSEEDEERGMYSIWLSYDYIIVVIIITVSIVDQVSRCLTWKYIAKGATSNSGYYPIIIVDYLPCMALLHSTEPVKYS